MSRLHGTTISNYYSTVKTALMEKGIEFEEVAVFPSQAPAVLKHSPMGKVPWLEIDGQTLTETNVIFDYLEDIKAEPALYPEDALARAKVKEITRVIELYLDQPARRHIGHVYFGGPIEPVAFAQARPALENGLRALKHIAKFDQYIAGEHFTFADIDAFFQLRFTNLHTRKVYDWDLFTSEPAIGAYVERVGRRPAVRAVNNVMQADMAKFQAR